MNFENNPNEKSKGDKKSEALAMMHGLLGQMEGLGRQDWESPAAMALIEKVMRDELTPEEGTAQMQAILDSKQVH